MKKSYRNILIVTIAICFSAAGFVGEETSAQTKTVKSTPTPKSVKSPTTTAKTTPKPTPKLKTPASQPVTGEQIIVTATASLVRREPKTSSAQLSPVKLGKTLPVSEKNAGWYKVEYAAGKSGWIPKTAAKDFAAERRDELYREITEKYSKSKTLDFATASEVSEFLETAQAFVKKDSLKADLSLRRLRVLKGALKAIPAGKGERFPYKNFLKANGKDLVYSDSSGEWYVRSDLYWEIHSRFTALPIAEEIAWEAAQNPTPSECEGYVNCYLYRLRATDGEYLNFYPNGKYSKKALTNITSLLQPIIADLNEKSVYTPPADISDRAEFNRFLTELRTIISKMPDIAKAKTLQQINQLGEGYK